MPEGSRNFGLVLAGASPAAQRLPPSQRRRLSVAAGTSLLLHAVVVAALLASLAHQKRVVDVGDTPAIVELVMSPPGNSKTTAPATAPPRAAQRKPAAKPAGSTPSPKPPQPTPRQSAPDTQPARAASPPAPAPARSPDAVAAPSVQPRPPDVARAVHAAPPARPLPARPVASATPSPAAHPSPPLPTPLAKPALQLDLGGIASDTNALVTGSMLLPPTADPKFRNRKPSYPVKAAMQGDQGAVLLIIHVSPEGLVTGVDIAQSSGYELLDRAARDAALSWHFLPAIRKGRPVRFDMPMRIVFALH